MLKKVPVVRRSLSVISLVLVLVSSFSFSHSIALAADPATVKVGVVKYVDGQEATALSAHDNSFAMSGTLGEFVLGPSTSAPYEIVINDIPVGSDYALSEFVDREVVGATCADGKPFSLVGYTTGDSLGEAMAGAPTPASPNFTAMTTNKFVVVWNHDCGVVIPPADPAMVRVIISKFIDGEQATAATADNLDFPMSAVWDADNIGAGSGTFTLGAAGSGGDPTPYRAITVDMSTGADYATSELTDGLVVAANCSQGMPFSLVGYTSGATAALAAAATPTLTSPSFTGMTSDQYVIVWNHDCANTSGTINGDVTGGSSSHGTLAVTSVEVLDSSAIADGTFANGWKYRFNVTVPDNETGVAMKFADWMSVPAGNTLAVAGNMRISSAQANNGGATIMLTAANTYSAPNLIMTGDLNAGLAGRQVQVLVEVAVPSTTADGAYGTSYGIRTQ